MERLGSEVSSKDYWQDEAKAYADAIDGPYHSHRLSVVRALLPDLSGQDVLDFGCGEGVMVQYAYDHGAKSAIGIDPEKGLLEIARKRKGQFLQGGVDQLAKVHSESLDCIICTNVLAYLTDKENAEFYVEARRTLRRWGTLVVTHSNDLFDLFTLNAYTVSFFKRHFGTDPSKLLTNPGKPEVATYNIRENPLAYPDKLKAVGFHVEQTEYINLHQAPPLLREQTVYPETLGHNEPWKLMFQCSTFGVRSRKD
jgi:SAM-dependent methyltransferase